MIAVRDESVVGIIHNKLEDYENILKDIMESENPDTKLAGKYRYYIMCLNELSNGLFLRDHHVFEILRQNYGKHDTQFTFIDGHKYTVKKDDICTFKDNYVSIMDKEEFEEGSGIIPSVQFSLNLDNVKVVETLS